MAFVLTHQHSQSLAALVGTWLRRLAAPVARSIRAFRLIHLLWLLLGIVFLLYLLVLVLQPSAVGRGGR